MKVCVSPLGVDLHVKDAPISEAQPGTARGVHGPVRVQSHVGGEEGLILAAELIQAGASHLFLGVEEELHVDRQLSIDLEDRFDSFEVGEELAFIIGGSPAIHPSVPDDRLEGGRVPGIQGLGRLNVVMPVDQQRSFRLGIQDFPVDQRRVPFAAHGKNPGFDPDLLHHPGQELAALLHPLPPCADGRLADKDEEFVNEATQIVFDVLVNFFHLYPPS